MQPIEQLLKMVEGQKQNMDHFVEHMGVIVNNVQDNLTKELLSHLIEEEHERAAQVNELIQVLREWQPASGTVGIQTTGDGLGSGSSAASSVSARSTGSSRLTVGSLIQY